MLSFSVSKPDANNDLISFESASFKAEIPLWLILSHSHSFLNFFDVEKGKILIDIKEEAIFNYFVSLIKGDVVECTESDLLSLEMIAIKFKCNKILNEIEKQILECKDIRMKSLLMHIKSNTCIDYICCREDLIPEIVSMLINEENAKEIKCNSLCALLDEISCKMQYSQIKAILECYSKVYGSAAMELLSHVFNESLSDEEKENLVKIFYNFIPLFNKELAPKQKQQNKEAKQKSVKTKVLVKPKDYTPDIFDAVMRGSVECVEYLISEEPGKLLLTDKNGDTPLHYASKYCQLKVARLLIKKGANPSAQNKQKYTPLHLAASTTKSRIVELLIKHGADPNAPADNGWTPMHDGSMLGSPNVVRCLIKHGGNVNILDNSGTTPLSVAGDEEVADILRENGAK